MAMGPNRSAVVRRTMWSVSVLVGYLGGGDLGEVAPLVSAEEGVGGGTPYETVQLLISPPQKMAA